jgi:hypothetical protein
MINDFYIGTAHLPRMGGRESHWEQRADVYAMHLQSGYAGCDRPRRQREHYATDTDAVRI